MSVPKAQDPMVLIHELVKALNLYANVGVDHQSNLSRNSNSKFASKKVWMQKTQIFVKLCTCDCVLINVAIQRLCFLWYLMLFLGFELKVLRRKFWSLIKIELVEKNVVFENFWTHSHAFHIHEILFWKDFLQKILGFLKIQGFQVSINWTYFSTNKKSEVFRPKLTTRFDSSFNSSQ